MSGENAKLSGTLLLDYATIKTATGFFALLALVLRSSGLTVVVMGVPGDDKKAAQDGIGYEDFKLLPASPHEARIAKFNWATQFLKTNAPVIWPDMDFGAWGRDLPGVDNIPGLVILNWAAVAAQGVKVKGAAQG